VLVCRDDSLYCGISVDVNQRLEKHNAGKGAKYTRSRRPCRLFAIWPADSQSDALRKEAAFKRLRRSQKFLYLENSGYRVDDQELD